MYAEGWAREQVAARRLPKTCNAGDAGESGSNRLNKVPTRNPEAIERKSVANACARPHVNVVLFKSSLAPVQKECRGALWGD